MTAPRAERLAVPAEYGSPTALVAWADVDRRLAEAHHYWLATVRPDGRPHVVPVDGLWLDGRLRFGGVASTVWQRNMAHDPRVSVHLDDSVAAVIVEGTCAVEVPDRAGAEGLVAASTAKYGYAPPVEAYLSGVWTLSPARVLAWTDLTADATRFVFP
jgi:hypothetical protein